MSAFLVQLGITGGVMLGRYIYHRLNPEPPPQPQAFTRTKVEEGRPVSLAFGRCLVRQPVQAWVGEQGARPNPGGLDGETFWGNSPFLYHYEAFFNICIPFYNGTQRIHAMYAGDVRLGEYPFAYPGFGFYYTLDQLVGNGSFEGDSNPCLVTSFDDTFSGRGSAYNIGGVVEFLNGNSSQRLISVLNTSRTAVSDRMIAEGIPIARIPSYRGMMSIFLGSKDSGPTAPRWGIGNTPHAQQLSFEISTYPASYYFNHFVSFQVGLEANPAEVIAATLCDRFGKLGLPTNRLDPESFRKAHETLLGEGHGYSRVWEERVDAREIIEDVLRQTDGVLYEEPSTGLIVYKLIRADYDPGLLLEVNPSTCDEVMNYAAGGWTRTVNKVRVRFEDRADEYRDNSATAQNAANAVGQDGEDFEQVLEFRGIKTMANAERVAARELAFRSRPLARCRVRVNRSFWGTRPGDVVRMSWPKLNIDRRVFRVGHVSRGTSDENVVYLDLVEDYFYVHRGTVVMTPPIAPFPGEVIGS